jgi:hypothetical protein
VTTRIGCSTVPDDGLPCAMGFLRQWVEGALVERQAAERSGRRFRTTAIFDGDPDLGERSKEICVKPGPMGINERP